MEMMKSISSFSHRLLAGTLTQNCAVCTTKGRERCHVRRWESVKTGGGEVCIV